MNSRRRMELAMRCGQPDRVPVMCQLSLGHYFLHSGLEPAEIWHSGEAFAAALISLREKYGFDGILVNLPGRDPSWKRHIQSIEVSPDRSVIHWKNGWFTLIPQDDNPHVFRPDGSRCFARFEEVDPDNLYYVEPHDLSGITYPHSWGFEPAIHRRGRDFFPAWHFDTLRQVVDQAGVSASVHGEVFSPFSQFLELVGYEAGLTALLRDPVKVCACLEALSLGAIESARGQAAAGAGAILISSAFAGGGLISRRHYSRFVLPYEKRVVQGLRESSDIPVYTHTCGAIGDRLDLLIETGTGGIDTLDPPPLGDVDLHEAKSQTAGRVFLKGNLDPIRVLLQADHGTVLDASRRCIATAGPGGGYILSTACSVAPATKPENIRCLREAADRYGVYPIPPWDGRDPGCPSAGVES